MSLGLDRIVVGYAGTQACRMAVRCAAAIAGRAGATLHVVSVARDLAPPGSAAWALPYEDSAPTLEEVRALAEEGAALAGGTVAAVPHACSGTPAVELVRYAREREAALIVLGNVRHPALERLLFGTTCDRVLRLSPVPCLLPVDAAYARRILVAADDSPCAGRALAFALRLAVLLDADLRCVHVAPPPPDGAGVAVYAHYFEEYVAGVRERTARGLPRHRRPGTFAAEVRIGPKPGPEILAAAREWQADLLVAGSHGRSYLQRAILGSTPELLVREAHHSLLIVPPD